jgi:hypothetical protein
MEDMLVRTSVLLDSFYQGTSGECRYRLQVIHVYRYKTNVGVYCWVINPLQSNFYATRILRSSYLFGAGKRLVGYL